MIHSFLMIGQSNMAGRGNPADVEPICNSMIKILRNGRWQGMYVPVNADRPFSGINLAESFADAYTKDHPGVQTGLIPCADGGTCLDQWRRGSLLYDHAVYQARLALRTSHIVGVLWHQGESDCRSDRYPLYEEKFQKIMEAFREDLNLRDVPFLLGGLGDYLKNRKENPELKNYCFVNAALQNLAKRNKMTGFVSAEGLGGKEDNLHFHAKALREFGLRYYEAFRKLENPGRQYGEKPEVDGAIRSEMELL